MDEEITEIVRQLNELYEDIAVIATNLTDVLGWGGEDPYLESLYESKRQEILEIEEKYQLPSKLQFYDLPKEIDSDGEWKPDDHDENELNTKELDTLLLEEPSDHHFAVPNAKIKPKDVYSYIEKASAGSPKISYPEDSNGNLIFEIKIPFWK